MVSPNNKRAAASLDDDEMVTPKKEKKTPAKTPKVVKLEAANGGTPAKSPMVTTPMVATTSAKKAVRKTPAKQKNLESVNTPSNMASPQAGKLSQPSPVQTRSARRKKAETNGAVSTPVSVAVTPSRTKAVRALGTKSTPKSQKAIPVAKGKKGASKTEESFKLELDNDLDSDDDHGPMDSDDVASDDEVEDQERVERLKAELDSIINKPASRKSILKLPKAETPLKQTKTPIKKEPISEETPVTPARDVKPVIGTPSPKTPKSAVKQNNQSESETKAAVLSGKRPSPSVDQSLSKKARRSIKVEPTEDASAAAPQNDTPTAVSAAKTPTKPNQTPKKGAQPKDQVENSASPAIKKEVEVKTPVKEAQTPGKKNQASAKKQNPPKTPEQPKTPVGQQNNKKAQQGTPQSVQTPAKDATPQPATVDIGKSPAPVKGKTPKKNQNATEQDASKNVEKAASTPAKGQKTPAKENPTPAKTPAKETPAKGVQTPAKTPAKETPAKGLQTPAKETPAKGVQTPAKTPAKGAQTPAKIPAKETEVSAKTPAKEVQTPGKGPAKTPKGTPAKSPLNESKAQAATPAKESQSPAVAATGDKEPSPDGKRKQVTAEQSEAKKLRKKAAKLKKKEAALKASEATTEVAKTQPKASDSPKKKVDPVARSITKEVIKSNLKSAGNVNPKNGGDNKSNVAKTREERSISVREKLLANGKSEEEIAAELPLILARIEKRIKRTVCLGCRKIGHVLKDCASFKTKPMGKCFKCGSTDHGVRSCSIKEEVYPFANCFICNQMGHLTRSCPSSTTGVYPFGGACFKCGDKSHLSKFCTANKFQDENAKPTADPAPIKSMVGILDVKQSADADVEAPAMKPLNTKQKMKKRVVKF